MTIDSRFLTPENLKRLEIRTLRFLSDFKIINEEEGFINFCSAAKICSTALSVKSKMINSPIDFQSYFDLNVGNKYKQRIHIGSLIQSDYSQVTYYLAICDYNIRGRSCTIRRKFHFDYDNGTVTSKQSRPRYHFQYAGEKPSGMDDHGALYEKVLYPSLSEPRFPYTPMSLALLLNYVFIEFRTEITNKISEDNKWRDLVKTNETKLLKPYYGNCWNLFNGSHSSNRLFTTDYCYGK